ncbi:MAG TPA: FAD-dependent oxidoreductase [Acidobacteriaceae bacterium]|nr:FAD-dependent oxidoreductase [Acidobacteriaceae bacterium]
MTGGSKKRADVAIAGGGIIGLALGLELQLRGREVVVLERGQAMREASWAAGGMLAVDDPQNPPAMMELARLSGRLYPEWLRKIEDLSRLRVPMRTRWALQWIGAEVCEGIATEDEIGELAPGLRSAGLRFRMLQEGSVDPRDLCAALPKAFIAAGGRLVEGCEVLGVQRAGSEIHVRTAQGEFAAQEFANCCGAWSSGAVEGLENLPVEPVKGQMVEMRCAPGRLKCVVRAPQVYLIPRGDGRVAVGATLERVGFEAGVEDRATAGLVQAARELMQELEMTGPQNAWAGLRPGTPDGLPVMGPARRGKNGGDARCWYATGHYRDGILLAPATARVMADAMAGERPEVLLQAFSAARFAGAMNVE